MRESHQSPTGNDNNIMMMDCSDLLSHVQDVEGSLPELQSSNFGHPPPPKVHLSYIVGEEGTEMFLAVAQTRRCISAQVISLMDDHLDGEPIEALCLDGSFSVSGGASVTVLEQEESEEEIKCATVFTLEDGVLKMLDAQDRPSSAGVVHAVIVVGTNWNRVLSMEFDIVTATRELHPHVFNDDQPSFFFEPLPLDHKEPEKLNNSFSIFEDLSASQRGGSSSVQKSLYGPRDDDDEEDEGEQRSKVSQESDIHPKKRKRKKKKQHNPFRPEGGVMSIQPFVLEAKSGKMEPKTVLIAYGDGTTIRLHHAGFFPSIAREESLLEKLLGHIPNALKRSEVMIPDELMGMKILPFPKAHPTLTGQMLSFCIQDPHDPAYVPDGKGDFVNNSAPDLFEAMAYGTPRAKLGPDENLASIIFFSSENHFVASNTNNGPDSRGYYNHLNIGSITGSVLGGTKKIVGGVVGGVFGAAYGAVKWGLAARGNKEGADGDLNGSFLADDVSIFSGMMSASTQLPVPILSAFPSIHDEPVMLFDGLQLHDAPRQIISVSIDPESHYAAAADALGRVQLIDLEHKQVIRMWKGVRDADCHWIQVPKMIVTNSWEKKTALYLVIHSKQRRVVEIWRIQQGPKVKSVQVGRDAQVIQCSVSTEQGQLANCFLMHSSAPGMGPNHIEPLTFEDVQANPTGSTCPIAIKEASSKSGSELCLQLLQQMLADTNVPSTTDGVFEIFTEITSLTHLCSGLDQLSESKQLEERMGVEGARFHLSAVTYCRQKLGEILEESTGEKADILDNPHVKLLSAKVRYHTQLIDAYEALYKFETRIFDEDQDETEEDEDLSTSKSPWAAEALGWIDTYETVTNLSIDSQIAPLPTKPLWFSSFAKACCASKEAESSDPHDAKFHVHFTDSTRTRTEILIHIFRPLLEDVFAYKTVNSIFDKLHIADDYDYLGKCFGEWFMTLPVRTAAKKSLYSATSPMLRWLQELVIASPPSSKLPLESLFNFCAESEDLAQAFLLATLCREAVSAATKHLEEKTYGLIPWSGSVQPYDTLLRKLRVALLVYLRLNGVNFGAFPLTVKNIDDGSIFSVSQWVARDELFTSHNHDEILMLEKSCKGSGLVFHPSSAKGDFSWKRLQRACVAIVSARRPSLQVAPDDKPGALLLYLSEYNRPEYLVLHRAILLGITFGKNPSNLQLLRDTARALKAFDEYPELEDSAVAAAVRVEVWQNQLRPVYRAIMFGFDDVPELSEEIMEPLVTDNEEWLKAFHNIALEILQLIAKFPWSDDDNNDQQVSQLFSIDLKKGSEEKEKEAKDSPKTWPPFKKDVVLKRLVERPNRRVQKDALDLHTALVCASLASGGDFASLSPCVPDLYDAFQTSSLFSKSMDHHHSGADALEEDRRARRTDFVKRAVLLRAERTTGGQGLMGDMIDSLDLNEIDILAKVWKIPLSSVKTTFLLGCYELSKDTMVDSLTTSSILDMDVPLFVSHGTDLVCRRLNALLLKLKRSSELRQVLSLLDADTCQFIRERAEESTSLCERYGITHHAKTYAANASVSDTHLLILRLLSLTAVGAPSERVKIHSLSVLSGTLVKSGLEDESA